MRRTLAALSVALTLAPVARVAAQASRAQSPRAQSPRAQSPRAQQQFPVRAGVTAAPDSVRIGDPFRVTVGVRAPKGATIEFPRTTDSTSAVQSLDPVAVRSSHDTSATEQ